jgi:hypothetical protein
MQAKLCAHSVYFGREANKLKKIQYLHLIDGKSVWFRNKYGTISVFWDMTPSSQLFTDFSEGSSE